MLKPSISKESLVQVKKKSVAESLQGSIRCEDLGANKPASDGQKKPEVGDYILAVVKSTKNKKSMHFVTCITAKDKTA